MPGIRAGIPATAPCVLTAGPGSPGTVGVTDGAGGGDAEGEDGAGDAEGTTPARTVPDIPNHLFQPSARYAPIDVSPDHVDADPTNPVDPTKRSGPTDLSATATHVRQIVRPCNLSPRSGVYGVYRNRIALTLSPGRDPAYSSRSRNGCGFSSEGDPCT